MSSLTLSAIDPHTVLSSLLKRFDLPCQLETMTWDDAWRKLTGSALYRAGADVSQIGTTWLDSLVDSGAVRPFSEREIEVIGGPSNFFPASWRTVSPPPWQMRVWAIPWLADVRVVFYWRDMLEEAGIDGETAFSSAEQVEQTMSRLQASGIAAPWGIWAARVNVTLHNAASWMWGVGGSIMNDTRKEILFDQPEAMEGILAYLRLYRYMPPGLDQLLPDSEVVDLFTARRVAVAMGPAFWFEKVTKAFEQEPETADKIGIAVPPGPAFVGGSHLIVWQHTQHILEVVPLLRFLASKEAQAEYCHATGFLPVRPDVLAMPPYTTDARYQVITEALGTGRTFPVVPRWGAVEERLGKTLVWLWNSLLADPDQDLEALAKPYIESTARRLVVTLGLRR